MLYLFSYEYFRSVKKLSSSSPPPSPPPRAPPPVPMSAVAVAGLSSVGGGPRLGGSAQAGLTRAGSSALTGIADPPSPSKPGSMEDAIKLWLKIGNVEKLQVKLLKDKMRAFNNFQSFLFVGYLP